MHRPHQTLLKEEIDDLEKPAENFNNFKIQLIMIAMRGSLNKEEYRTYMNDNVIPFMEKVEEFTETLKNFI